MKKIYHLKTCDTNKRILRELRAVISKKEYANFSFQEIKTQNITVAQLEEMRSFTDSYESLFSKRAKRYKLLKEQILTEKIIKQLILEEYTFLKRPVIIIDDEIFIGNSKKNVALMLQKIGTI